MIFFIGVSVRLFDFVGTGDIDMLLFYVWFDLRIVCKAEL